MEQAKNILNASLLWRWLMSLYVFCGAQWRSSGALWYDLVSHSAENIAWLQENGVEFSGVVDNYGSGLFETMHWWKDNAGAVGYVPPMQAAAEANGAEFRFSTGATSLVIGEDGAVRGVYAQTDDGKTLQVNAKAVILASGGIGANRELLPQAGMPEAAIDEMIVMCVPTVCGDGFTMASAAGCKSYLPNASIQAFTAIEGFPMDTEPPYSTLNCGSGIVSCGLNIWVDQDANRFTDESISLTFNVATPAITCMGNKESYVIFNQALLDMLSQDPADKEYLDAALAETMGKSIYEADTIEALGEACGLPVETLKETVEMYNGFCRDGFDGQSMCYVGRSYAESPDIDGRIYFTAQEPVETGAFVQIRITGSMDGELTGELAARDGEENER